jgi:uncharacterized protein (TIGR00369 family)
MNYNELQFDDRGLIPCIVQDALTRSVLMMAWMNRHSLELTIKERTTWFWSRSRKCLWHKGETSGNTQRLVDLRYDCDGDTLLALVEPAGPACHTGHTSCFYRSIEPSNDEISFESEDESSHSSSSMDTVVDKTLPLDDSRLCTGLMGTLGIEFTDVSARHVAARMPISDRVAQPHGFVHGGATIALLESVASAGSEAQATPDELSFGVRVTVRHRKSAKRGLLYGEASFDHAEGDYRYWTVRAYDDAGDTISDGSVVVKVVARERYQQIRSQSNEQ